MTKLAALLVGLVACVAQNGEMPGMGSGSGSGSGSGAQPHALAQTAFAYAHHDATNGDSISIIDLATGTNTGFSIGNPQEQIRGVAVSHDRKFIAFTGLITVYVIGVDGSNLHQITPTIFSTDQISLDGPTWSPDDSTLYLGFGKYTSFGGGDTLATIPISGGPITHLQAALNGNDCTGITDPAFSPDGSYLVAIHSTCVTNAHAGLWKHTPDGTGQEYLAGTDFELSQPIVLSDGTVLALGGSSANGILVVQNGAITNTFPPPAGYSMDQITLSPDGNTLVIAGHDLTTFKKNLYATTDFQNFTPLTTDGASNYPAF